MVSAQMKKWKSVVMEDDRVIKVLVAFPDLNRASRYTRHYNWMASLGMREGRAFVLGDVEEVRPNLR